MAPARLGIDHAQRADQTPAGRAGAGGQQARVARGAPDRPARRGQQTCRPIGQRAADTEALPGRQHHGAVLAVAGFAQRVDPRREGYLERGNGLVVHRHQPGPQAEGRTGQAGFQIVMVSEKIPRGPVAAAEAQGEGWPGPKGPPREGGWDGRGIGARDEGRGCQPVGIEPVGQVFARGDSHQRNIRMAAEGLQAGRRRTGRGLIHTRGKLVDEQRGTR